ncbi:MAG: DUF3783 domain-containing protein [Cellulosilyticaceae bacterium]
MSFERIDELNQTTIHPRNCILFYNFTAKEVQLLKNIANLTGMRDQIILTSKDGECVIQDILDNQAIIGDTQGLPHKAIIFNPSDSSKVNSFLESLKKCRIPRPLTALITSTSLTWTVNHLLENLIEERASLSSGVNATHS